LQVLERFLDELSAGIITAGGTSRFSEQAAQELAGLVWLELKEMGEGAFPCLVEREELRFIYQWDETPAVLTVMLWDDQMWRDMARIEVPLELQ
jgi:hypothetical protein